MSFASPKGSSFQGHATQTQSHMFNTSLNVGKQESFRRAGGLFNAGANSNKNPHNNLFYNHKQSATNIQ
jgi:hypothetical protein